MSAKPNKSKDELVKLIRATTAKHPEWGADIEVTILPSERTASHQPNWKPSFIAEGRIDPKIYDYFSPVQNQFDLA